ncbi:MAG: single-stranded-DNA-specific exonuclease RecJ [Spirochaetes bacterium]|nr:single-stranded-DNA-specific exonuclease RecJ [Spirochaetota bacterium]
MKQNWSLKSGNGDAAGNIAAALSINPVIASIISRRNITTPADAYHFLHPRLSGLHSPFLMHGMDDAVRRIRRAIDENQTVALFSDSDLDGLTSLTTLVTLFRKLAPELTVRTRYPRNGEQYGLTNAVIDELRGLGATLLITLDCGTRDVDEIAYAAASGMDTIVCDHHEPDDRLPGATIVNPRLRECRYPFKELAGVGVAFKLCHAVLMSYLPGYSRTFLVVAGEAGAFQCAVVVNGAVERTAGCATPGEVAALAEGAHAVMCLGCGASMDALRERLPDVKWYDLEREAASLLKSLGLDGDGRSMEKFFAVRRDISASGIDMALRIFRELQYRRSPKVLDFNNGILSYVALGSIADIVPLSGENRIMVHYGLESLKSTDHEGLALLLDNRRVNTRTIGWHVAPVLNAPGRMGKADYAADLLLGRNGGGMRRLMDEITSLNEMRKSIVAGHFGDFMKSLESGAFDAAAPLVFAEIHAPEGVAGLIANRIADTVNRPVIVVSRPGEGGLLKGSGRVKGNLNFFACVEPLSELFEKIGGHAHAFGFTVREEMIGEVKRRLEEALANCVIEADTVEIDHELTIGEITTGFISELSRLEPYGNGNEEPVFLTRRAAVRNFSRLGGDRQHGKYLFSGNGELEALGWGMGDEMERCAEGGAVDIIYRLEISHFNGRTSPRIILIDISPSD